MACIASDGALLTTARQILEAADPPAPAPECARRTGHFSLLDESVVSQ